MKIHKNIKLIILLISITLSCSEQSTEIPEIVSNSIIKTSPLADNSNCSGGTQKIEGGIDLNNDGQLSQDEIQYTNYICNGSTNFDGNSVLTSLFPENPTENCIEGGYKLRIGIDLNKDTILNDNEIIFENHICDKIKGLTVLNTVTDVNSGNNCPNGGKEIKIGLDLNSNNTLDENEIIYVNYVCNGVKTFNKLNIITDESSGVNCPNGGKKITNGIDTNDNGALEQSEITSTNFICNDVIQKDKKFLIDFGDSLTAGFGGGTTTMSSVTATLLGSDWIVQNMGVGGENTLTIAARQGAIPMYIKAPITIPADGSKVKIPTYNNNGEIEYGLYSSYNDKHVDPLLQGSGGINPCYIEGIECTLSRNTSTGIYYINRNNTVSKNFTTSAKSIVNTSISLQTSGVATFFVGENGGYSNKEELLEQIDKFVEHKGDNKFIIITSHGNGSAELVEPIKAKYGNKHIDLKKYMSTRAIYDAIDFGLLPNDGIYPTLQDFVDMSNNNAPTSLRVDAIHLNAAGYVLLGKLRYKKGKELGYW